MPANQFAGDLNTVRFVRSTLQRRFRQPNLSQHRAHGFDMYGFAIVRPAGDRHFLFTEPKTVGRPRKNHWQSLKWFTRRTQVSERLRRAQGTDAPAVSVNGNQVPTMSGFDYGATPDFDEVITAAVFSRMKRHENSILTGEDGKIKRRCGKVSILKYFGVAFCYCLNRF